MNPGNNHRHHGHNNHSNCYHHSLERIIVKVIKIIINILIILDINTYIRYLTESQSVCMYIRNLFYQILRQTKTKKYWKVFLP